MKTIHALTILLVFFMIGLAQTSYSQYVETCENTKSQKAFIPVDLEYDIAGGSVIQTCKIVNNIEVIAVIDAHDDGQLTIHIPKKLVYTLAGTDCQQGYPLIFDNGQETIWNEISNAASENIITVGFTKGKHNISFIGSTIIPDPSPAQYCGIVMGFDSIFLPPKFQTEKGVAIEQIRCNEGLIRAVKTADASPICVKQQTKTKLIQRNLVLNDLSSRTNLGSDLSSRMVFSNEVIIPKGSSSPQLQINVVPQTLTIFLDQTNTVIWTNLDDTPSTIVSDDQSWATGLIKPNESVSTIFNHTGVYDYHGSPHPWKKGTIIVKQNHPSK